jgi:hypothetical protein
VASGAASGITTAWFLAPMLHCTRLPAADARAYTCLPAASLPTKDTARMSGWSQMPSTTACVPCTTFSTPRCSGTSWNLRKQTLETSFSLYRL